MRGRSVKPANNGNETGSVMTVKQYGSLLDLASRPAQWRQAPSYKKKFGGDGVFFGPEGSPVRQVYELLVNKVKVEDADPEALKIYVGLLRLLTYRASNDRRYEHLRNKWVGEVVAPDSLKEVNLSEANLPSLEAYISRR